MDKRTVGARALRMRGWTIAGEPPPPDPVSVMIGAPHTSNWDLFLMLWLCWASDVEPRFLMKKEAFRGPGATAFRRLGGIAVDRSNPGTLLEDLSARAGSALATGDRLQIVIAPEGTRKAGTYWKSGFYRLAHQSSIPICLGWCDGPTRTVGYGPTIRTTGDVRADMDRIREFYATKRGVNPKRRTIARLREEDRDSPPKEDRESPPQPDAG